MLHCTLKKSPLGYNVLEQFNMCLYANPIYNIFNGKHAVLKINTINAFQGIKKTLKRTSVKFQKLVTYTKTNYDCKKTERRTK